LRGRGACSNPRAPPTIRGSSISGFDNLLIPWVKVANEVSALEVCYHYGRQLYTVERCTHCGLSFCEHHTGPDAHCCLAFAKERRRKRFFLGIEMYVFVMLEGSIYFLTHVVALV